MILFQYGLLPITIMFDIKTGREQYWNNNTKNDFTAEQALFQKDEV